MRTKSIAFLFMSLLSFGALHAQGDKKKPKSPPATFTQTIDGATITINYAQPSVKERIIFGDLVPYGKVWRTGANDATTFTTDKDIMVNGQKLAAGTYALFTIPGEKEWTIIFNSVAKQWGAYNYKEESDVLRINVSSEQRKASTEKMTFSADDKGMIHLDWATTRVSFKVKA
jgi:hypothetical protein